MRSRRFMVTCELSVSCVCFMCLIMRLSIRSMNKVDATMDQINEQRELANEISEAISNPLNAGIDLDEVRHSLSRGYRPMTDFRIQDELKDELAELEREELDERLMGAERAPLHSPSGVTKVAERTSQLLILMCIDNENYSIARHLNEEEDEEEAQLKELQASLAM